MEKIIEAVSEYVSHEIRDDKRVVPDGFMVSPFMMVSELEGDGNEEEISTSYQVDIFYTTKSELLGKAKQIRKKLKTVCEAVSDWAFLYILPRPACGRQRLLCSVMISACSISRISAILKTASVKPLG